jgi:hypothetical protein
MLLDICKDMNHSYGIALKQVKKDYDIQSMIIDKIKNICDEVLIKTEKRQKEIMNDGVLDIESSVSSKKQYNMQRESKVWKDEMRGQIQMEEQCKAQKQLQERVERMRGQIQMEGQRKARKQCLGMEKP